MLEKGKVKLGNVPHTIKALKKVRRLPDGTFDLRTVDAPVRALCWGLGGMAENLPPADYEELDNLPEVDLPSLDQPRRNEGDFMRDLVEVANIVRKYLILVAGLWPIISLDPLVRSVVMGHMVRVFKLYDTLIFLTVERRTEVAWIVSRTLVDTIINLRWLLKHPNQCQRYVRQSLAFEKKLMEEIKSRMREPPLPIETRMLRSIEATFSRAGVNPAEIKAAEWRGLSSEQKARDVGLDSLYEFSFRGASHNVHGTWHDLEFYHLELVDGVHRPAIRFHEPRPQIVEVATIASLDAAVAYVGFAAGDNAIEITGRLEVLRDWVSELSSRAEEWFTSNQDTEA
jgi:hypothetical protein